MQFDVKKSLKKRKNNVAEEFGVRFLLLTATKIALKAVVES